MQRELHIGKMVIIKSFTASRCGIERKSEKKANAVSIARQIFLGIVPQVSRKRVFGF